MSDFVVSCLILLVILAMNTLELPGRSSMSECYKCSLELLVAFCAKILGDGGDLRMVLCHSMNAG